MQMYHFSFSVRNCRDVFMTSSSLLSNSYALIIITSYATLLCNEYILFLQKDLKEVRIRRQSSIKKEKKKKHTFDWICYWISHFIGTFHVGHRNSRWCQCLGYLHRATQSHHSDLALFLWFCAYKQPFLVRMWAFLGSRHSADQQVMYINVVLFSCVLNAQPAECVPIEKCLSAQTPGDISR